MQTHPHDPEEEEAVEGEEHEGGRHVAVQVHVVRADEGAQQHEVEHLVLQLEAVLLAQQRRRLVLLQLHEVGLGDGQLEVTPGSQDHRRAA